MRTEGYNGANLLAEQGIMVSQRWFERLEKGFLGVALILFTQAFFPLFQIGRPEDQVAGDPLMQTIWKLLYGISLLLILLRWRRVVALLMRDWLLVLILLLVMASFFWSAAPEVTLRRIIAFFGTYLVSVYMAARFSLKEQFYLVAWMLLGAAVSSLIVCLALPENGIMYYQGGEAWKGIFSHKNQLGRLMCLGTIGFFLLAYMKDWPKWLAWSGFGLCLFLLYKSNSKTALLVCVILFLFFPFLRSLRWKNQYAQLLLWMLGAFGLAAFLFVAVQFSGTILGYFGRDLTLTGRTELWSAVIEMIQQRPFFGYGYSAFWLGWEGESAYVWLTTNWNPPDSHNGYLDVALEIGLVGLALVLSSCLFSLGKAIRYIVRTQTTESFWPLLYLVFLFLYNMTENTLLSHNSFYWILFVSYGLSLSRLPSRDPSRKKAVIPT